MQRKLFRSMTALSATATVFSLLLLAAGPASAPTSLPAMGEIAVVSPDAAAAEPAFEAAADPVAAARQRHHIRRTRSLLALPYFSFAQGLRHGRS
jgi:hypothetical protein